MNIPALGACLFDRPILEATMRLWEGPMAPEDLPQIEKVLRAYVLYDRLAVFQGGEPKEVPQKLNGHYLTPHERGYGGWSSIPPWAVDELNNEFVDVDWTEKIDDIPTDEALFLKRFVTKRLEKEIRELLPKEECREWQLSRLIDVWYATDSLRQAERAMRNTAAQWKDQEDEFTFNPETDPADQLAPNGNRRIKSPSLDDLRYHDVLHLGPVHHAYYLVELHAKGFALCSTSVVSRIANEHIFSKWPNHLFAQLDNAFREEARLLLGPGFAVPLPPFVSIVLSRSRNRDEIPQTILQLRKDFEKPRAQLWTLLGNMWTSSSYREQCDISRQLELAAAALYDAAFPKKFDALSLSYSLVSSPKGSLKDLLARDSMRKVRSVSFAHLLSKQLLLIHSHHNLLKRHFSQSELRDFRFT